MFSPEKQATHQAHSQHTVKANAETTTQGIKRDQLYPQLPSHNVEPVAPNLVHTQRNHPKIQKFREKASIYNESKSIEVELTLSS